MSFSPQHLHRIPPTAPSGLPIPPAALRQIETVSRDLRTPAPRIPTTALFFACDRSSSHRAAEALAASLGRDLLRIDHAAITSRKLVETERDLRELFRSTDPLDSILFFAEADALFSKRTEIRDSHDRYREMEIQDLLELLQEFPGLAILACTSVTHPFPGQLVRYTLHLPPFASPGGSQPTKRHDG
jgi:hypothetical protein